MKNARLVLMLVLFFSFGAVSVGVAEEKCITGDCLNGKGTYVYSDGSKYVGEYKNGKINGQGKFTYPDGSVYIGEYKNNKMNGMGTFIYPNGDKYVGEFNNNQMNDKGKFIPASGRKAGDAATKKPETVEKDAGKKVDKATATGKKELGKKKPLKKKPVKKAQKKKAH
ncbi:MAG: hypothetical protein HQM02_08840 [Magnetococcales bacterium]|nr:hypothetical protein [Magnetococcales bacterium]